MAKELVRRVRRLELAELTNTARLLARDEGQRCHDCGALGRWDPHREVEPERLRYDKQTGEVQLGVPGAVVCPRCDTVISRSRTPRVAGCGRVPSKNVVELRALAALPGGDVRAAALGLRRCGAAWRCPHCAKRQQTADATTLHTANVGFRGSHEGGEVYMLTLTIPHRGGQRLEPMRRAVTRAYQRTQADGKKLLAFRKRFAVRATVRRLEATRGPAGWHPHIHCMMFCARKLSPAEQESMREWWFLRWGRQVERTGYGRPSKACITITVADKAGRYLAKMGLLELAGDHAKRGRCSECGERVDSVWQRGRRLCAQYGHEVNRTPFEVLRDFHEHGAERDRLIWREYYHGILGARRLTWSRWRGGLKLREAYPVDTQATLDLVPVPDAVPVVVYAPDWCKLAPAEQSAALEAYERGDRVGLELALDGLTWEYVHERFDADDPEPAPYSVRLTPQERAEMEGTR